MTQRLRPRLSGIVGLAAVLLLAIGTSPMRGGRPVFLDVGNLADILRQVAEKGILAAGMTPVIISGGIDLSVGSILALAATLAGSLLMGGGMGVWPMAGIVLAAGCLCGLVSGFVVTRWRIQPFVATLAMTQKQIVSLLRTVENTHLARESRMLTAGTARENRRWVTERMAFVARKSMKTADDVYGAMLARGFSGAMPSLVRLRTTARDWVWVTASVLACAALLGVDRMVLPR